MSFFRHGFVAILLAVGAFVSTAHAAGYPHITAHPETRIVVKVDNTKLVTVPYSVPARVANLTDMGRVPASTQFNHMMLVLKNTDEQEFALRGLLDQQQDKSSVNYHQWMTPETFGAAFGASSADIAQITAWLQDSGFSIDSVAKSGRVIEFSGTSSQVETAFHTEMHEYMVNGEVRISNSTAISIPQALSPVVAGVGSLNNFRPHSAILKPHQVMMGSDGQLHPAVAGKITPDFTSPSSGTHYVGAGDIAVIYDLNRLFQEGYNGAGQKIALLGQTDILLGDIQIYRSLFELPPGNVNFIQVGGNPGTIGDDIESDLDTEVSGAFAPGATIDFYLSGNSDFGGGIASSAEYVIENNSDDIISLSYGECEADLGVDNEFFSGIWEQASAQGQSVFVSTGDSGPDVCDDGDSTAKAYSVSGLSSTPFNVAAGGSMFNEGATTGTTTYWGPSSGPPYVTALSYIPEIPWNEGVFDPYGATAGYGGITASSTGISIEYGTPSWQAGPGVPTTDPAPPWGTVKGFVYPGSNHRYQPDVVLPAAGGHDGTLFCSEGSCVTDANGNLIEAGVVGGTSVAAPSMAGVQADINQANGGRQGLPNYYYYRLAAVQSTANCDADFLPSAAGASCNFHDIQSGNTFVPTTTRNVTSPTSTNSIGWLAGAGYDMAAGLGSPDVYNMATAWSTVSFNATTTSFTLTPTTSAHGATYNIAINVTPVSGTGVPTGDVSIIAEAAEGGVGFFTLSNGSYTGPLTGLPAGSYNVYAHYTGDTTYGGSNSAPIAVVVSAEPSTTVALPYLLGTNASLTQTSTFTYGSNVYIEAGVLPPSGIGTPTGNVTFTLTGGPITLAPYTTMLDPNGAQIGTVYYNAAAYLDAGLGLSSYDIASTYSVLPVGTYTVNISYAGDSTFGASSVTPFTITVGPLSQTLSLTTSTAEVASGGPAILNASITTISPAAGGLPATGTVTFTDTTTSAVLGTGTLVNGAVVFNTNALTHAGANSITATYSGDTNYQTKTSSAVTITVGGTASTTTLATTVGGVASTTAQVGQSVVLTATVPSTATGTVYFYDGAVELGTGTVSTSTHTATRTVTTFTAATHVITATYNGNTTLDSSTSTPTNLIIAQNTPTLTLTAETQAATTVGVAMNASLTPTPANAAPMNPLPTGPVNFIDTPSVNGVLGTPVTLGSTVTAYQPGGYETYVAGYTTPALKPGTHVLSAQFAGDTNYAVATSNTQTISIGLTTIALSLSGTNIVGGAPLTLKATITPNVANTATMGGTVTFYSDGTTLLGTVAVSNDAATLITGTPTLTPGVSHSITAIYSGDSNYYTSTSSAQTVILGITSLTLTSSTANVGVGIPFTLTATISPVSTSPAPTGTVTFYDGTSVLGTATGPFAAGKATLANVTLSTVATHTINAVYSGDTNYYKSSATSTVSITSVTPGFSIVASPTSLTITRGSKAAFSLIATTYGNYSGYGLTTITGLPANSSYIVLTSPIQFNGVDGPQTYTLYITTTAPSSGTSGLLWIPAILLASFLGIRRKKLSLRSRQLVALALLFCGMMAATGCGGSGGTAGTPTGTSSVTINVAGTGTTSASPNMTATAPLTLIVQ